MDEVISWLIGVEKTAADIYEKAAILFRENKDFSEFMLNLSEEEKEHVKLLQHAQDAVSERNIKRASFYFDNEFRTKIETPFVRAEHLLQKVALTKSAMIDIVVDAEFSEWNEVLIYTIDTLNVSEKEAKKIISDVEQHRINVQNYISRLPDGEKFIQKVRKLSKTISKRILIVEENHAVARMLEALVAGETEILIAQDGQEGIDYINRKHFDLVISEVELQKMTGIEMYRKALEIDPSLSGKFFFFTSTENSEYLDFLRSSNISFLPKPSPVRLLNEMIHNILDSDSMT
jgi:CheY-like chemotaxis protein/predicted CopG family antitoxin